MGGETNDVELLLASVRQEIDALRADRRLSEPRDGNRGKALYQHVCDLIGAAEHQLKTNPSDGASEEIRESFLRSLRALVFNLRSAHAAMPWLAATRSPQINLGALYLAEECAEILVGQSVDLVVVPDPEYMYSAQSWPFIRVVEAVEKLFGFSPETESRPVVLRYPLSDDNRLLVHAIFAHELGHPAADEFDLAEEVLGELEADTEFEDGLANTAETIFPATSSSKTARTLREWLRDWLEEIVCDHLAIEVSGPSYLWAFAGFVMPLSYDGPSTTHPPNTLRVRLMLDLLAERGWDSYLEQKAPDLSAWLKRVGEDADTELEAPYGFFREHILRRSDLFRTVAARQVDNGDRLGPEAAIPEAERADELLRELILPLSSNPVLKPRAILLGGWQRALAEHGDHTSGLVESLVDYQLQDLVGKAIELSVVASCWEEDV